ncbi:MAG: hypothetical protein D6722_20395 [Bacteroidetes bacterium]|nr:MAG: hypothetical protein D6722_20395 [Bacteroidota bacterium]
MCFELNVHLQLNLRKREEESPAPNPPSPPPPSLLSGSLPAQRPPLLIYEDVETVRQVECLLCTANRRSLPPVAKPFPYFFLVHFRENAALPWNMPDLLAKLNAAEAIISAVDLTHIKNIKQVLP